jgi:zinc protease
VTGADLPTVDIPYTRFTLDNGLTVIVHEDHKAPVVAVNVWYHIGSKDEPEGRHGFAHLFEHLMFYGSQHFDDEFFRALEPAGATDMNGTTNTDRTNYFETVPTSALDRALWLESDRMGYLSGAITQAKLDQQRGVVENEKRQDENQPYGKIDEIIARETYPSGHPYSWTTIGSEKDLDAATLADVRNWFRSYYGPNNAVLVVAGDIDPATLKAKIEHYFGGLPPGPPVPHVKSWTAPMIGSKHLVVEDHVPLPRVYLVWNVPGDGVRDSVMLQLFAELLGGGRDSRLYKRLVYTDQIASSVSASVDANEIGGQLQIVATAKPNGSLAPIEKAIDEEVEKLLRDGPRTDEVDATRTSIYAGFVRGVDKVGGFSGKAGVLAANQVFHGDPAEYKQEIAWQREATPADLTASARRWLNTGRLTLEVLPLPELKAAQDADRSVLPVLASPHTLKLPPLQRATLSNGLKLIVAERHDVPVVEFQMLFDAGRAADAGGRTGTASMALDMMDEGAGDLDALAIAHRQNELGATLGFGTHRDVSVAGLSALKPRLAESLDLYATVIADPRFPAAELARIKQQMLAGIATEKAQPFGLARRVLSRLLYGEGHAYAYAGVGLEKDVQAITRDDLIGFRQHWLRPDNATLVVAGDTTLAEIQPLLEAKFGNWRAPATALPAKNVATVIPPAQPRIYLLDKPGAEQSLVLAANLAPPASDPDIEAMRTVNTILGGMFVSRLNSNLREARHWSYGAGSFISDARGQQIFAAYAPVERAHTVDSMIEMRKELNGIIGGRPLTASEIDAAKQTQVLALPGEFEGTPALAAGIDTLVELNLPDDYWDRYVPTVESLNAAELATAAQKAVKPQALTWIVVGDLSRIEPAIRAAGFGPIRVLDADGSIVR